MTSVPLFITLTPLLIFPHQNMNLSDHLPHYLIFFLLLLLFFITVCAYDDNFKNCSSLFSCGTINNIGYPFWGYNRAEYCGQPGFQLTCQDNKPKLMVNSVTYRILNLSLKDQNLKVARDDYWKDICPSQYTNTSFDSTMFKLDDGFQSMAFLYDCISTFNPSGVQLIPSSTECSSTSSSGSKRTVYYGIIFNGKDLTGICKVVVIPVLNISVGLVMSRQKGIEDAIEEGFGLTWSVDNDECNKCVKSGGKCGYMNKKFTCFCRDGRQGTECSSGSGIFLNRQSYWVN